MADVYRRVCGRAALCLLACCSILSCSAADAARNNTPTTGIVPRFVVGSSSEVQHLKPEASVNTLLIRLVGDRSTKVDLAGEVDDHMAAAGFSRAGDWGSTLVEGSWVATVGLYARESAELARVDFSRVDGISAHLWAAHIDFGWFGTSGETLVVPRCDAERAIDTVARIPQKPSESSVSTEWRAAFRAAKKLSAREGEDQPPDDE